MDIFVLGAFGLATQGASTSPPILWVKLSWYDHFQHNKNAREFQIYFTAPQCLRQLLQLILRHKLWRGRWSTTFWRRISQWCIIAQYIYQGIQKYGMNILIVSWLSQGLVNSKLVKHVTMITLGQMTTILMFLALRGISKSVENWQLSWK